MQQLILSLLRLFEIDARFKDKERGARRSKSAGQVVTASKQQARTQTG